MNSAENVYFKVNFIWTTVEQKLLLDSQLCTTMSNFETKKHNIKEKCQSYQD